MNDISVILLLLGMTMASAYDSVQVVSFRKSRLSRDGQETCAMDTANKTISPSSLQDCSLDCTRDLTCSGFNIKHSHNCDLYNYNPKLTMLVTSCTFYQVGACFIS